MTYIYHFLEAFILFAPVFVANGIPVVVKNLPILKHWNAPLWERGFGKNKTWRGLVLGVLGGALTAILVWGILLHYPLFGQSIYATVYERQCSLLEVMRYEDLIVPYFCQPVPWFGYAIVG